MNTDGHRADAASPAVPVDSAAPFTAIDPADGAAPSPTYAQAALVTGDRRLLFLSGQPPVADGVVPADPEEQCRVAWRNVLAVLAESGMSARNLVKVTIYTSDRRYRQVIAKVRREFLGDHRPALMGIVSEIWEPSWVIEIEAVAAA